MEHFTALLKQTIAALITLCASSGEVLQLDRRLKSLASTEKQLDIATPIRKISMEVFFIRLYSHFVGAWYLSQFNHPRRSG
jgi:hypothetical protein